MAIVTGGKHFGQYTYEHWFDGEYGNDNSADSGNRLKVVLKNFRIIDEETDMAGSLVIENGVISEVLPGEALLSEDEAAIVINGAYLSSCEGLPVLMPAFVDLHAHFRDPGPADNEEALPSGVSLPSEVIESASLAAAAGGFGTVICMANTKPPIDTIEKAAAIKSRGNVLGLVDIFPVLSLTKNMEGKELSEITAVSPTGAYIPPMLSEDGKDLADNELFFRAMKEAKRIGIPVSCHCDLGGDESKAVHRVIALGRKACCHVHIAHVSLKETVEMIRRVKARIVAEGLEEKEGFKLTCEVMPHHLCLTSEDAAKLGVETWGKVNPPLRSKEDRQALIRALADGTIDAIATDHAPHSTADKKAGAPGFSGFETAFAAVYTALVHDSLGPGAMSLKKLSSLMSASPARLLGLKRGRIIKGYKADLVMIDTENSWKSDPASFKSRGKNSPFADRRFSGKILLTIHSGRVVFV